MGVVLGAAVLPLIKNLLIFAKIPDAAMPVITGVALIFGVMVDEAIRRGRIQAAIRWLFRRFRPQVT